MRCAVGNCNSLKIASNKSLSFFNFPTDAALLEKWIQFCRRDGEFNPTTSRICIKHFSSEDIENEMQFNLGFSNCRRLKRGTVPKYYPPDPQLPKQSQEHGHESRTEDLIHQSTSKDVSHVEDSTENIDNSAPPSPEILSYDRILLEVESKIEALELENCMLKKENKKQSSDLETLRRKYNLQQENHARGIKSLQKRISLMEAEIGNMEGKLSSIFTKGQVMSLKVGTKVTNWSEMDIAQSITLYAASPKAYRLFYKKKFPLPGIRTLNRWVNKFDASKGFIEPVFTLLAASTQMDPIQKLCVLSFGEMKIRRSYRYDISSASPVASENHVQVVMLRGLMSRWKQPVFYDFDCKMNKELLESILKSCHNCGYNVVAVVSDLDATHLFNDLNVNEEKPWFFFNGRKIFVFVDVPQLLKLLRYHFLDEGFLINGKPVQKEIISELLSSTSTDFTIAHKISASHLNVSGPLRQKVKTAAELFSHTVAQAITRAASLGHLLQHNWKECFQLFKITNDWFDVLNVRVPRADERKICYAYGIALEEQDQIINQMTAMMKRIRVIGKQNLLPFQKGIIQTNNALQMLFADVKNRFDVKYLLTYRFNKDILYNFFGVIRSKDGWNDHPDQQEFKYRLKMYLLGRNDGVLSDSANVEMDDKPDLEISQPPLTGIILKRFQVASEPLPVVKEEFCDLEQDGLENLAGFISHQLRDDIPSTSVRSGEDPSYSWANHLTKT